MSMWPTWAELQGTAEAAQTGLVDREEVLLEGHHVVRCGLIQLLHIEEHVDNAGHVCVCARVVSSSRGPTITSCRY